MNAQAMSFLQLLNSNVQFMVPLWQRRYRWGQDDIERLIDDLITVSAAGSDATHYGGTLLTFPEPGASITFPVHRVVDGQQRLTTVSILLACIAEVLGADGKCGEWTRDMIFRRSLLTGESAPDKKRKLKLQQGDEEEYQRILEKDPEGFGAVTQAWRILRRLVEKHDLSGLLAGLERLRAVHITLDQSEDPQQIFESLNATGRPLSESEKIKNWLLMGLPDAEQKEAHKDWLDVEKSLDAENFSEPVDAFFRDFLRWKTGKSLGIGKVYEEFRSWAVRSLVSGNKAALGKEIVELAKLYGMMTGAVEPRFGTKAHRELRHLRNMGIDVHRPLTLRLLWDANGKLDAGGQVESGDICDALAKTLGGVGAWITRLWLADRSIAGLNTACAELAFERGPPDGADVAGHWIGRIRKLRNTRVGVPTDGEVREGLLARVAYGGPATKAAKSVLWALMEDEKEKELPDFEKLTVEHIMPRKLTDEWSAELGADAESTHASYLNRLTNLTLSGFNPELGAKPFAEKKLIYRKSSLMTNRTLAEEEHWDQDAMDRRSDDLIHRSLERWQWFDPHGIHRTLAEPNDSISFEWRIEGGAWSYERTGVNLVLNFAAALLDLDESNSERLAGEAASTNMHRADRYPPGKTVGTIMMRAVPGHERYVVHPYETDSAASAERCRVWGERCRVRVDVKFRQDTLNQEFWSLLKDTAGGLPGQKDSWQGPNQWATRPHEPDVVAVHVGNEKLIWLTIRPSSPSSPGDVGRMRRYSYAIRKHMADQQLTGDIENCSSKGRSISVQKSWDRNDREDWPEAACWIKEQCDRLFAIAKEISGESNAAAEPEDLIPSESAA